MWYSNVIQSQEQRKLARYCSSLIIAGTNIKNFSFLSLQKKKVSRSHFQITLPALLYNNIVPSFLLRSSFIRNIHLSMFIAFGLKVHHQSFSFPFFCKQFNLLKLVWKIHCCYLGNHNHNSMLFRSQDVQTCNARRGRAKRRISEKNGGTEAVNSSI